MPQEGKLFLRVFAPHFQFSQKTFLCQGKALFADTGINYKVEDDELLDIQRISLPLNSRYNLQAYGDASFAVGDTKQSLTGFIIYFNGVPLIWGSLKQTVVVDSSSSAEFVAAALHASIYFMQKT